MSSSAFSLTLILPAGGVEVTRGELVRGGDPDGDIRHMFCDRCKTWVLTHIDQFGIVNVRATLLDDASWFSPYMETYAATRLRWVTTPAVKRYDEFPANEDYPALLADYAVWAKARGWPVAVSA